MGAGCTRPGISWKLPRRNLDVQYAQRLTAADTAAYCASSHTADCYDAAITAESHKLFKLHIEGSDEATPGVMNGVAAE